MEDILKILYLFHLKFHLQHVVEQMHCSTAHVDGDWVEEEDRIVLSHTGNFLFRFQIKR